MFVYWRFFVSICRCLFVVMIDREKPYLNGDPVPGDGGEKDASIVLGHSSDWQQKIWRWDNKYNQKPGASKYCRFPCYVLLAVSWSTNENPSTDKLSRAIN